MLPRTGKSIPTTDPPTLDRRHSDSALSHSPSSAQLQRGGEEKSLSVMARNVLQRRVSDSDSLASAQSPPVGIESFLDPFFRLPWQLSEYERSLVHFCQSQNSTGMTRFSD
jgi:hypothetical protein